MNNIGITIGENTVSEIEFISTETIQQGLYVCIDCSNKTVLGMVTEVHIGNLLLNEELVLPTEIEKILNTVGHEDEYTRAKVKILGDIETLKLPRTAIKSNTYVRRATTEELIKVFEIDGLEIGKIITDDKVNICLNTDQLVSKHLAILAMTGSGKSNTTAVLIDEILKVHGCIILFDIHSEYSNIEFKNGKVNRIKPQINLADLTSREFIKLAGISKEATTQERVLYQAIQKVEEMKEKEIQDIPNKYDYKDRVGKKRLEKSVEKKYRLEYLDQVLYQLKQIRKNEENKKDQHSIDTTISKIRYNLQNIHKSIIDEDSDMKLVEQIKPNCVNILDFESVDTENVKIIIEKLLRDILRGRKNHKLQNNLYEEYIDFPVLCMIEEAHTLASKDEENSGPKYQIGKIAKEGRKFGVGLCLISQRPKTLDSEILSQVNNWIVLKIVEPGDQRYIQECSDNISTDLIKELPNLNTGEAIITGPMVKMPSISKINLFDGKKIGQNIKISNEWQQYYEKNIKV